MALARRLAQGCAVVALCAGAVSADVIRFRLDNHPDGAIAPPYYGMRLDNLFNDSSPVTFSFTGNGAGVLMDVDTTANTIHIFGTVYGGRDNGAGYTNPALYTLNMNYNIIVSNSGGWYVVQNAADSGTLTQGMNNWNLVTEPNGANRSFEFFPDGFRLPQPDNTWVGRGWLDIAGARTGDTRDFLFTATVVPIPAGVWIGLAGLGGVGLVRRFSRRR